MNFRTEFPDYPAADMPTMPEGFTDQSWHNDTCPCWARGDLVIWCDYVDTAKREWDDGPRFVVARLHDVLFTSDDWADVIGFLQYAPA
jgi:hypothetical protein